MQSHVFNAFYLCAGLETEKRLQLLKERGGSRIDTDAGGCVQTEKSVETLQAVVPGTRRGRAVGARGVDYKIEGRIGSYGREDWLHLEERIGCRMLPVVIAR